MNKLIIVGNGFDIHNGLATRYSDFLNWYFNECFQIALDKFFEETEKNYSTTTIDDLIEIGVHRVSIAIETTNVDGVEEIVQIFLSANDKPLSYFTFLYNRAMFSFKIDIKSKLLENLLKGHTDKNWVDIEMSYYKLLKKCLSTYNATEDKDKYSGDDLLSINKDLNIIKLKLEEYLIKVSKGHKVDYDFDYCAESSIDRFAITDQHHLKHLERSDFEDDDRRFVIPKDIAILNFNYTGLPYGLHRRTYKHIDIHGALKRPKNKPIFGFGDEVDTDYHEMEKTNINAFLTHIKSFGYFHNSNYHDLTRFLESDPYVVYIWGHSCGLSDRTLLSMIFEHDNCVAIKPYYWEKSDNENNYTEITQNISRHVKDKIKLRNRVVNLEFCRPLGSQF